MCGSVLVIQIRIHKAPEHGSNTDPDPQRCRYDAFLGMQHRATFKIRLRLLLLVNLLVSY